MHVATTIEFIVYVLIPGVLILADGPLPFGDAAAAAYLAWVLAFWPDFAVIAGLSHVDHEDPQLATWFYQLDAKGAVYFA